MAIPRTTDTDDSGSGTTGTIHNNAWLQLIYDAIESWDVAAYTPSWTGSGSNPAIGNGSIVGKYLDVGDAVNFRVVITMGSTTTYGTGNYSISLPLTAIAGSAQIDLWAQDASAGGTTYGGKGFNSLTTAALMLSIDTAGVLGLASNWTPSVPFTFAQSDVVYINGRYLRA